MASPMRPPLPNSGPPSWRESALWTFSLGTLFFLVYGGTNWVTSLRSDVGTLYFEWERMIPFVPTLIIPYMSIDLFFAASPFLCTSRAELHTLAKRAIFAILISAACFLMFPFQFAFDRPQVNGLFGKIFTLLTFFDRPYNLLPSLHISLLTIIWAVYRSHTRGVLRAALDVWFVLIAISTVLTYQHHVLDVVTGALVGILAFPLLPDDESAAHRVRRDLAGSHRKAVTVGTCYVFAAVALSLLAYATWPWGAILTWPALALTSVAAAYFWAGPRVFRKSGGRLPIGTRLVLAPYLWGVRLSHFCYRRGHLAYAEVFPGILIGRQLNEAESEILIRLGVEAVLDLTVEFSESMPFLRLAYQNVHILDLTVPTLAQLNEAVAFIQAQHPGGSVYIHCALGYSRSACITAAYLLAEGQAETVPEAIMRIKKVRPEIVMHNDLISVLKAFHAQFRRENEWMRVSWAWKSSRRPEASTEANFPGDGRKQRCMSC